MNYVTGLCLRWPDELKMGGEGEDLSVDRQAPIIKKTGVGSSGVVLNRFVAVNLNEST